jgi:anti-sigma B factor antagonist
MIAGDGDLRWIGDHAVATMPAEIDVTNADAIRQALRVAVGQGSSVLIIDMSATTFCDSAGLQAIIDAHNLLDARNQNAATRTELRLVADVVRRIILLVGLDQLIPVYPTLEAALAGAAGGCAQSPDSRTE